MIFAIELSTRRGSIALVDGARVVAARGWDDPPARHGALWPAMESLVAEARLDWSAVTLFAAGRGPGSYSGLRAALTAAQMLAAPGAQPVTAVSSGAALAAAWFESNRDFEGELVIAGDARRGRVWYGIFARDGDTVRMRGDWSLVEAPGFRARFAQARVVSSEAARFCAVVGWPSDTPAIEEAFPDAAAVARLAKVRQQAGEPSEPLEPLYLHPPV